MLKKYLTLNYFFKFYLLSLAFLSGCSTHQAKEFEPPSVTYEIKRVGDFAVSNSPVFSNVTFINEDHQKSLIFKLIIKNMNPKKNFKIDLALSKIVSMNTNFPANCHFISTGLKLKKILPNEQIFISCKVNFTNEDIQKFEKNDLIAEVQLPIFKDQIVSVTKIHVRNEKLNE